MRPLYDNKRRNNPPVKEPQFQDDWITSGIKSDAITYAEELGSILVNEKFSTSQIRNFYGELKRIQLKGIQHDPQKSAFHLLRPKLAYAAKRAEKSSGKGKGANIFKNHVFLAHTAVKIDADGFKDRFQNFCDLCEAILAFHKAYGGKD